MPPSPQEIKARLDKVVDQEGNVLDMGTVLDIVSILEKVSITKEALETTRIGRIINLLRKKTNNEELAKRAKKLVKKWQKLVSNHFKNLSKPVDSPGNSSRTSTPILQVNGIPNESAKLPDEPKSCGEDQKRSAVKRKRISTSAQSSPINNKHSSDSITILNDRPDSLHNEQSNLLQNEKNKTLSLKKDTSSIANTIKNGKCEESNIVDIDQEISNCVTHNNLSHQKDNEYLDRNLEFASVQLESVYDIDEFQPTNSLEHEPESYVPEESLAVKRKPLECDAGNPINMADGVNGCFDEADKWCYWTDFVIKNEGKLSIYPYVTLD